LHTLLILTLTAVILGNELLPLCLMHWPKCIVPILNSYLSFTQFHSQAHIP